MSIFLGLDIGGTSLKLGAWAGRERLIWNQGIAVPDTSDPDEIVASIASAVRAALEGMRGRPEALGIGSCGLISDGVIHQSPNTPWDELPLEPMLQDALRLPVILINDADAFLLGVLEDYAPGLTHVIGITLGTGLGAISKEGGEALRKTGSPLHSLQRERRHGAIVRDLMGIKGVAPPSAQTLASAGMGTPVCA